MDGTDRRLIHLRFLHATREHGAEWGSRGARFPLLPRPSALGGHGVSEDEIALAATLDRQRASASAEVLAEEWPIQGKGSSAEDLFVPTSTSEYYVHVGIGLIGQILLPN